jgi:hypothetical protein
MTKISSANFWTARRIGAILSASFLAIIKTEIGIINLFDFKNFYIGFC